MRMPALPARLLNLHLSVFPSSFWEFRGGRLQGRCVHDGVPRNESSQAAMPSSLLTEGLTLGRHTGSSISHVTFIYFL